MKKENRNICSVIIIPTSHMKLTISNINNDSATLYILSALTLITDKIQITHFRIRSNLISIIRSFKHASERFEFVTSAIIATKKL